ncbi:MAG: polyprenyl synthetase family protein [Oscillospiraceae bacterium]|nr:polyprenyl synthetase family protein [Oscillospiraceae bacterium]
MNNVTALLKEQAERFEHTLEQYLPGGESVVAQAMRYSLMGGGKRIRPVLAQAFCALFGGRPEDAAPLAVAIELVHCYSLVHDDLPCMDNDDMRRGRPACHKQFGEQAALLAGSAMLCEALLVLHNTQLQAECRCEAVNILMRASIDMIEGQWQDLSYESVAITRAQLEEMNALKTGALLRAACELGCLAAGASEDQMRAARQYAAQLGLLFQLTDDILDVTASSETLGKTAGKDAAAGKNTWVSLLGLPAAQQFAHELAAAAQQAIAGYADAEHLLYQLPQWLLTRNN